MSTFSRNFNSKRRYLGALVSAAMLAGSSSVFAQDSGAEVKGQNSQAERLAAKQRIARDQALYYYFTEDYFASLTQLALNDKQGIGDISGQSQILRAGLELSYDMNERANEEFRSFDETQSLDSEHRSYIYFRFAKAFYKKGQFNQARQALNKVGAELAKEHRDAYHFLNAQMFLKEGNVPSALTAKDNIRPDSIYHRYLAFNYAMSYIGAEDTLGDVASNENIIQALQSVVDLTPVAIDESESEELADIEITDELEAIIDRSYLALGYLYLEQGENQAAMTAFENVAQQGLDSESALLGYGWAKANNEEYETAVLIWQNLASRNNNSVFAQEARLAVGYGFEKMHDKRRAFAAYQQASDDFSAQKQVVDNEIAKLSSDNKAYIESLMVVSEYDITLGLKAKQVELKFPSVYQSFGSISSDSFQQDVKDINSLGAAISSMKVWQLDLLALAQSNYQINLETSQELPKQREVALRKAQLDELSRRYRQSDLMMNQLAFQYIGKLFKADPVVGERHQLRNAYDKYMMLSQQVNAMPASDSKIQMQQRLDRLGGALLWQIGDYYLDAEGRLAKQQVANDLSRLQQSQSLSMSPVNDMQERIEAKMLVAENILQTLFNDIEEKLVNVLSVQQESLADYLEQAKISVIRMTDEAFIRDQQLELNENEQNDRGGE
ncbi:tetratricopeptide repeat protein [Thalassotalea sp. Y01]|uniref:tetratricopeptide repeat protein n=1 Tax=Thalassotalea sp. Y01 TaxID=2729613 RepID=UPI00145DA167|nr:tetratricopeptide repeat protein [Thalassotalea sp. Y01]NMP16534.1 hypothetical protein [Thalassotalea sp. Y01]